MATLPVYEVEPLRPIWEIYDDMDVPVDDLRAAICGNHEPAAHEIGWARDYEIRGIR